MRPFYLILGNSLVQNLTNFTVWFALLFWAFLATHSVFVTGVVGGVFMALTASLAIWFGNLVDHHKKKHLMLISSIVSLLLYSVAYAVLLTLPEAQKNDEGDWSLWVFIVIVMTGVVAGNVRTIALPTLVTALIPEPDRAKANGLVGIVNGAGLVATSAISGFLVSWGGMEATLLFAIGLTLLAIMHIWTVRLEEPSPVPHAHGKRKLLDLHGTFAVIAAVPGLTALILLATFNNLLGGVFMALIDAYGLSLMNVQQWGVLWALASLGLIVSGVVISRKGVGKNPVRTLLVANAILWLVASVFTLQSSVIALGVGCFIYLLLYPVVEAAEQTALQKLVPYERQGRVFGLAQSIEQIAAPTTSFLVGPITQFVVIPFMTTGAGARAIGSWYGTGPERGMAVMFSLAGVIGVVGALIALKSSSYKNLSASNQA
jgi:DHA3 family multidrug efflux protein-like MFS transporter